jgi:hypothetical protein
LPLKELVVGLAQTVKAGPRAQVLVADVEHAEELEAVGFAEGAEGQALGAEEARGKELDGSRGELGVAAWGWGGAEDDGGAPGWRSWGYRMGG